MNRDELIEKMARAAYEAHPAFKGTSRACRIEWEQAKHGSGTNDCWNSARAALSTLCASIPGLEDVIAGKAVIVPVEVSAALRDVTAERKRQKDVEGWTPEHDNQHVSGEMAVAASCYAELAGEPDGVREILTASPNNRIIARWPWSRGWWKPTNRRRDLVKAGALIIAEIERLDRAQDESMRKRFTFSDDAGECM